MHETIEIAATPEVVWAQLVDPQNMAAWHAKLVDVRRSGRGAVSRGEWFETTYVMGPRRPKQHAESEVVECDAQKRLVLRHHFQAPPLRGYVDESYTLESLEGGRATRLRQTVDLAGARLPLWMRALAWCIGRTGEPRGEGILEPLKRACEAG